LREGYNVKNTHYNYIPTATGPGHASIYTGTTPANHGIVGNVWYNSKLNREVYCAEDGEVFLVDVKVASRTESNKYSRSAKNLLSTTISDELKLSTNMRSKVIGISLKDRGAIFPAGHLADYAFWYNEDNGNFITSTYYAKNLPEWLIKFNNKHMADSLLNTTWNSFLPAKQYNNSGPDDVTFEKVFKGRSKSTFPYNLKKIRKNNGNFKLLTEVPFGNSFLTQMAMATIDGEKLGQSVETDFLTISYSSTDYVGHYYGIRSKELEDTYVRMDREISKLLSFLDDDIGKDNYLIFLTSDHAASDSPTFMNENRLSGKYFSSQEIGKKLNEHLGEKFGQAKYVSFIDRTQVYINKLTTERNAVLTEAASFLKDVEGMQGVYIPEFKSGNMHSGLKHFVVNSYNPENSGSIFLHFQPGWMERLDFGTTHGSAYNTDTHAPLLWFGWNIPKGQSVQPHTIDQIAPTLSFLLNIPLPNTANDNPILELFK